MEEQKATIWWILTMVGLLGFLLLSVVTLMGGTQTLHAGRAVPGVEVTSPGGISRSLRQMVEGRDEIFIVAPNCDICAAELDQMVEAAQRARRAGEPDGLDRLLLLVVRNPGIPRTSFMSAYSALTELGLVAVFIQPGPARDLGVERVPVYVRLDGEGKVVSVDYAEVS